MRKKNLIGAIAPNHHALTSESLLKPKHVSFPETGFVKLWQIIGDKKRNIPPVIPVSRSNFLAKVKSKEWPQPVQLGEGARSVAWKVSEIRALIEKLGG